MHEEQPTDLSKDITTDKAWIDEQIDRLLGWEFLRRELMCDVTPIGTAELCDNIGVNKGYVHAVLKSVKPKFQQLKNPN